MREFQKSPAFGRIRRSSAPSLRNLVGDGKPMARNSVGFTLIELMMVVGVAMVIMVMSVPTVVKSYGSLRLRSCVGDVGGLVQQTRSAAVRQNAAVPLQISTSVAKCPGCTVYYVDYNNNGTLDAGEPEVILPAGVTLITDGSQPVSLNSTNMPGCPSNIPPVTTSSLLYFNARGLPCPYNSTYNSCSNSPGPSTCSVFYFNGQAPLAGPIWAAISVSPAGRVQVWNLDGSTWQ